MWLEPTTAIACVTIARVLFWLLTTACVVCVSLGRFDSGKLQRYTEPVETLTSQELDRSHICEVTMRTCRYDYITSLVVFNIQERSKHTCMNIRTPLIKLMDLNFKIFQFSAWWVTRKIVRKIRAQRHLQKRKRGPYSTTVSLDTQITLHTAKYYIRNHNGLQSFTKEKMLTHALHKITPNFISFLSFIFIT